MNTGVTSVRVIQDQINAYNSMNEQLDVFNGGPKSRSRSRDVVGNPESSEVAQSQQLPPKGPLELFQ